MAIIKRLYVLFRLILAGKLFAGPIEFFGHILLVLYFTYFPYLLSKYTNLKYIHYSNNVEYKPENIFVNIIFGLPLPIALFVYVCIFMSIKKECNNFVNHFVFNSTYIAVLTYFYNMKYIGYMMKGYFGNPKLDFCPFPNSSGCLPDAILGTIIGVVAIIVLILLIVVFISTLSFLVFYYFGKICNDIKNALVILSDNSNNDENKTIRTESSASNSGESDNKDKMKVLLPDGKIIESETQTIGKKKVLLPDGKIVEVETTTELAYSDDEESNKELVKQELVKEESSSVSDKIKVLLPDGRIVESETTTELPESDGDDDESDEQFYGKQADPNGEYVIYDSDGEEGEDKEKVD